MPQYSLRFTVETCLTHNQDLTINYGGHHPVFLFSQKTPDDSQVIARVETGAANSDEAWNKVSTSLLPPILDALSFATGTPLLLRDCQLVLKDQTGSVRRRALYIGHEHFPHLVPLQAVEIQETTQILATGQDLRLPLCWHRYALDRELAHEQFVFNWLAFEALVGDTDVASRCPRCQQELEHCGSKVSHRSSSKITALQIFQAAHPDTTKQEFNNEIWSRARNSVFHGRRYPEPNYLVDLSRVSQKLHTAVDRRIDGVLGLGGRLRPHRGYEQWARVHSFVEWETNDRNASFATDCPLTLLKNMTDEEELNGPAHQAVLDNGIVFLNYNQEYAGW